MRTGKYSPAQPGRPSAYAHALQYAPAGLRARGRGRRAARPPQVQDFCQACNVYSHCDGGKFKSKAMDTCRCCVYELSLVLGPVS